ncbi:PREDICTED: thrombomodulin-like [Elephantulus edwardii]|uniref:thrombomodulin-like n=1 Tax=Elephantulus edwardii TaxID=28737 RepID=UPI0003F07DDC|nr:PREDICTED: thrombomodulin-like [Elephantulus edwardii]
MLRVLLLGVLAPAGLGFPAPPGPQPHNSQCIEHDCFALFRGQTVFYAANQTCERLQGHLMTVRSSVSADVISLLLSGDGGDGSFLWIGLELPPGCHDPRLFGPLRGFQWVTGDNRTSYSRWAKPHSAGESLCSPLCVGVSAAGTTAPGELVWKEQPCSSVAQGFLCEFHFSASCRPLAVEPGGRVAANISYTYSTPFGARGMDFQTLPVGSSASVAALGAELVCSESPPGTAEARWDRVAPGAWDCAVENGGCEHECEGDAGLPRCLCPAERALQADGRSCEAHSCNSLCDHFCVLRDSDATDGAYTCMCETGFQLAADQHTCEDVDDCMLVPSPCPQLCVNKLGGFDCHCHPGYELVDGECVELPDPCFGTNCEYQCEQVGRDGYRCVCAEGFAPSPKDPHRCQLFCNQTSCPADCDPHFPESCHCPDGYILDEGSVCADIDECSNNDCPGLCRNLPGSYECICGPDSAFAGQTGTDCDSFSDKDDDVGSGEGPASPTPSPTTEPQSLGPVHSGVLIGISIASLSLLVALLALLCHLSKKQGSMQTELEYKCATPTKEVMLKRVRTEPILQKL